MKNLVTLYSYKIVLQRESPSPFCLSFFFFFDAQKSKMFNAIAK